MGKFQVEIDAFIANSKEKLLAVTRSAIGDIINEAQTPGPSVSNPGTNKGGKMPVATGFLRASGMSNLNSLPFGPSVREKNELNSYQSQDDYTENGNVTVDLGRFALGDKFYFGWSAEYANAMEVRYGFVASSVQNWQQHVTNRANEVKNRSKT